MTWFDTKPSETLVSTPDYPRVNTHLKTQTQGCLGLQCHCSPLYNILSHSSMFWSSDTQVSPLSPGNPNLLKNMEKVNYSSWSFHNVKKNGSSIIVHNCRGHLYRIFRNKVAQFEVENKKNKQTEKKRSVPRLPGQRGQPNPPNIQPTKSSKKKQKKRFVPSLPDQRRSAELTQ